VLTVSIFFVTFVSAKVVIARLAARGLTLRRRLLLVHTMLVALLALGVLVGPPIHPHAAIAVLAGLLGACTMAAQNARVQATPGGALSSAGIATTVASKVTEHGGTVLAPCSGRGRPGVSRRADRPAFGRSRGRFRSELRACVSLTMPCGQQLKGTRSCSGRMRYLRRGANSPGHPRPTRRRRGPG
jgi:hypothetical protein